MRLVAILLAIACAGNLAVGKASAQKTTLTDPSIAYRVPERPYVVLARGDVEMIIVDNSAVADDMLPDHYGGYSGLASLKHSTTGKNIFVPQYAGLNFEHVFDGTSLERKILFEPRRVPVELRQIDEFTVELYRAPMPHFGLETCERYALLPDGVVEMTVEAIPRRRSFANGYVGMFWASYIHEPASLNIHFRGFREGTPQEGEWIDGVTPRHGLLSTHLAADDDRTFAHAADFPLSLVFNRSHYRYTEPWYYGVTQGLAVVQMFRPQDLVRFTQSPSGGGAGNPAWDFQYLAEPYEVDRPIGLVMRLMCIPYESPEQVEAATIPHRRALNGQHSTAARP